MELDCLVKELGDDPSAVEICRGTHGLSSFALDEDVFSGSLEGILRQCREGKPVGYNVLIGSFRIITSKPDRILTNGNLATSPGSYASWCRFADAIRPMIMEANPTPAGLEDFRLHQSSIAFEAVSADGGFHGCLAAGAERFLADLELQEEV